MIHFEIIGQLSLEIPPSSPRPAYLSAASGLVRQRDTLYVIADDEHHLGIFPELATRPGQLLRIVDGDLPADKDERKAQKPDFEALTILPAFGNYSHGALLAFGSGSKRERRRGCLFALGAGGEVIGRPHLIDFTDTYKVLKKQFDDLNIEGAAVVGDEFILLQRGNKGQRQNAVIRYTLAPLLAALAESNTVALEPDTIVHHTLGDAHGVPLCFTDLTALPGGELMFTAVAEDTDNSIQDGPCVGAAIGLIDREGGLQQIELLAHPHKIEGLHAWREGNAIQLLAVTDADNPAVPAAVLRAAWRLS